MTTIARNQYDTRPTLDSDLNFANDPGVTKQADLKESDINLIFKRFEKSGQLPNMILKNPTYGDYSNVPDYQESINIVRHAEEQFLNLDVQIRNRFENDPAKFLGFVNDPKNMDEMEQMGLLKPEAVAIRAAARKKEADDYIAAQNLAKTNAEKDLIAKIKAEINK